MPAADRGPERGRHTHPCGLLGNGRAIAGCQHESGAIPWFPDGPTDPWDHVQAAMGLTVTGFTDEAERAYDWLRTSQRADGTWGSRYVGDALHDPTTDANYCAYVATGVFAPLAGDGRQRLPRADVADGVRRDRRRGGDAAARRRRPVGPQPRRHARHRVPRHRQRQHPPQPAVRGSRWPRSSAARLRRGRRRQAGCGTHSTSIPSTTPPRTGTPWTGTTRSSAALSRAPSPGGSSTRGGPTSSSTAWASGACATGPG